MSSGHDSSLAFIHLPKRRNGGLCGKLKPTSRDCTELISCVCPSNQVSGDNPRNFGTVVSFITGMSWGPDISSPCNLAVKCCWTHTGPGPSSVFPRQSCGRFPPPPQRKETVPVSGYLFWQNCAAVVTPIQEHFFQHR